MEVNAQQTRRRSMEVNAIRLRGRSTCQCGWVVLMERQASCPSRLAMSLGIPSPVPRTTPGSSSRSATSFAPTSTTRTRYAAPRSVQPICVLIVYCTPARQDAEMRVELVLHMRDGATRVYYFQRTGRGIQQRGEFERRVNVAGNAAQRASDEPSEKPSEEQPSAAKKPRVETRAQKGAELRALLREVSKLKQAHKVEAAREKLASAETGRAAGKSTIKARAGEMANVLFTAGGLETTRAVLDGFLRRTDVRQVLPEATAKTRAQAADAATARAMLEVAKAFFNQLMGRQRRWVEGKCGSGPSARSTWA
eukprot:5094633-Prymnesium_polylepis.1